jgi:hypothetical protein
MHSRTVPPRSALHSHSTWWAFGERFFGASGSMRADGGSGVTLSRGVGAHHGDLLMHLSSMSFTPVQLVDILRSYRSCFQS